MQRYIEQLIADIRRASWNVKPPHELWLDSEADPDNELELEDMSFIEQYVEGEELPIAEITGLAQEQLPAPEKLSEPQQALLSEELEKLLEVFHFKLGFPAALPANLRYPFIRNFWGESHVPLSFSENHIEFCDYDQENCPFPGYCTTCKEVEAQRKFDEETGTLAKDWDFEVDDLLLSPAELEKRLREQRDFMEDEDEIDRNIGLQFTPEESAFVSGLFDDDGDPDIPESVPVPELCTICKQYEKENPNENLFCQMTRFGQRNAPDFKCSAFKKQ